MVHFAPLTMRAQLLYLAAGAVLSFGLALSGLLMWRTMDYYKPVPEGKSKSHGFDAKGLSGLVMFFSFAFLSVALLFELSQSFVRYTFHPTHTGRGWLAYKRAAVTAQFLLGAFYLFTGLIALIQWGYGAPKCAFVFCIGVANHPSEFKYRGEFFNALLSVIFFFTLVPLGLVVWYRVFTLWSLNRAANAAAAHELSRTSSMDDIRAPNAITGMVEMDDVGMEITPHGPPTRGRMFGSRSKSRCPGGGSIANPMSKPPSLHDFKDASWQKQLARNIGVCAGILFCAVISFYFPNDPRRLSAYGIANFARLGVARDRKNATMCVPDMPNAYFRTGQIRICADLVLKLFPGNVFFYAYLLSVVAIVFVLRQSQQGRYWMQRRIPHCACFTFGEAGFIVATALMSTLFFIYWLHDHNFKTAWNVDNPDKLKIEPAERWGRALGQLAVLFLSVLLLPVGRQSVVVTVLGVSRNGLLWFHRAVGYAMLAATLGHIIAFYVSYHEYGLLLKNLNTLPNRIGRKGVFDDYTMIVATWTTWFLLIAMGIFGLNAIRRRYYELFYYTHLAATYSTLPMMLFHASAGWMYLLPGLTIFLADQLVRVWQRSAVVRVVHARTVSEDTVELAFSVPGRWDMRRVYPGQYVLVSVPELTALQWHPFTLTNVVDGDIEDGDRAVRHPGVAVSATGTVFYLHIKAMGPLTWTGRLYDLVRSGQEFSMSVEGPCGTPVDFSHYDDIVLVAGGIGVAPCSCIYAALLRQFRALGYGVRLPRVRVIWSTRSGTHVNSLADLLHLPVSYGGTLRHPLAMPLRALATSAAETDDDLCAKRQSSSQLHKCASSSMAFLADKNGAECITLKDDSDEAERFPFDVYVTRPTELHHFAATSSHTSGERAAEKCAKAVHDPVGECEDDAFSAAAPREDASERDGIHSMHANAAAPVAPYGDLDANCQSHPALTQSAAKALGDEAEMPEMRAEGRRGREDESQHLSSSASSDGSPLDDGVPLDNDTPVKTKPQARMERGSNYNGVALQVHEGRPDVDSLLREALTDPSTGKVSGDVTRKLILVCGPEQLVDKVIKVGAAISVPVHKEEFLF